MSDTTADLPVAGAEAVLARRYAGALYDLAREQGALDAVAGEMRGLRQVCAESAAWREVAHDARLSRQEGGEAAAALAESIGLGKLTGNFLGVLAQNRRLTLLAAAANAFLAQLAAARGEVEAEVSAAVPLSHAQQQALAQSLAGIAGGKVRLTLRQDKDLLGGVTVKMGSVFIDASVKAELDRLERSLIAGAA